MSINEAINIQTTSINAIAPTTGSLSIGDSQTSGILNLGTGGATRTGNINIGSTTMTGKINIETANANGFNVTTPAIAIGTNDTSKWIKIGSTNNIGLTVSLGLLRINSSASYFEMNGVAQNGINFAIGNQQTTGFLGIGTGSTSTIRGINANVNIANQASNACAINIMNGGTTAGSVNIANGTGITQTTTVNIGSGSTTGLIKIGNSANQIELNAPTLLKATKQNIVTFASQAYTLTEATSLTSSFYGSTYTSATPSTINDVITVTLPTPTTSMLGMTLVFRKMRGALNTSSANWSFTCPTSSFVQISLTAGATPTVSTLSINTVVVRFTVLEYSGSVYYFQM